MALRAKCSAVILLIVRPLIVHPFASWRSVGDHLRQKHLEQFHYGRSLKWRKIVGWWCHEQVGLGWPPSRHCSVLLRVGGFRGIRPSAGRSEPVVRRAVSPKGADGTG